MQIPTKERCYRLMCEMKMLDHIVLHSMQVCRVAKYLTSRLIPLHCRLSPESIQAAALLHDITKTRSFKTKENHALTGGQFLAERGYPEIGELVRQHVRLDVYAHPVVIGEAEILNYADKRVLHDEIVSLNKRLDYILDKYATLPEHRQKILWLWQKTQDLEEKIFENLTVSPDDLNRLLNSGDRSKDFLGYQKVCNFRT